jgi:DNA invertase Pin-like site-specific DNA recombinase
MLIGYARVSTGDQSADLQKDALQQAGCERIFTDTMSGWSSERPGLGKALDHARKGDTIVVWKLDRFGRSLRHLVNTVASMESRGVGFKSITESIDTTTSGGRLVCHIFAALAEFEREIIRERTKAALAAARARGRTGGRPTVMPPNRIEQAKKLLRTPGITIKEVCEMVGIGRSTLYRHVDVKNIMPKMD